MKLCDLHCHSGLSRCCKIEYKQVIDEAKAAGFNSIVLTNHYAKEYFVGLSTDEFIDEYYNEFELTKEYGKLVGVDVFFGVEVTMEFDRKIHLLVYGINKSNLKKEPELYNMSLEELSNYCRKNNFALIQAHPFRGGATVLDTNYLDGIEINCHPQYGNTFSSTLIDIALNKNLTITCGCDYHGDVSYRPKGGLYLDDDIDDEDKLANYLKNNNNFNLKIHEINHEKTIDTKIVINK